jgi:photolyase PhrII
MWKALPGFLLERTRPLNDLPVNPKGEFVLYWMHHAVRGHENPALDVALWVAERLTLPVLVYQGLGGRHPYNNDRHHTFILEGAGDVEAELTHQGISYCFHLPQHSQSTAPLRGLVARAALSLTEDFPVPPLTGWTRLLATTCPAAFWVVDTACILPMQKMSRSYSRAFKFRNAAREAHDKRIPQPYPTFNLPARPFRGKIGFTSVPLAAMDIAACCAACAIDHSVGPVSHTRGGSQAGYRRWKKFLRHGLSRYAETRQDAAVAFPSGVSRMSAYIHHGHVSPFRLARQAAASASGGARKFLDEFVIWRELSHNFCFYHDRVDTLDVLPAWARESLENHRRDRRSRIFTWETLARARTGDRLWDAAQRSLLIHGELHNNLRMTWGKALLQWTRTPQNALQLMIDLNHRFALDGSDPNSYAGILWCLGLFDRPFKPPQPVLGVIRPRSTRSHAKRLDLFRYEARVNRPTSGAPFRVAVIGAGLSGLVAARTLLDHGHRVRIFEKARGVGGRLATRRSGRYAFDHGAQYFTARDGRFTRWVGSWREAGVAKRWDARIAVLHHGQVRRETRRHDRYVGVPGMSALAGHLAGDLNIRLNTRVQRVRSAAKAKTLFDEKDRSLGDFDALVVTAPPAQSVHLLAHVTPLVRRLTSVNMFPCWAVILAFAEAPSLPFDGAFVKGADIAWAACNSSKPGRGTDHCWVIHATPDWSRKNLALAPEDVVSRLTASFAGAAGVALPETVFARAHRWRYAQAQQPLADGCIWDPPSMTGVCGDWCCGSRIEGAFLSGAAIAGRILSQLALPSGRFDDDPSAAQD